LLQKENLMQIQDENEPKSLGRLLVDQHVESVVFHNATILAELNRFQDIIGEPTDSYDQRRTLAASLQALLKGARNVDEIADFGALKLPDNAPPIRERVEREKALAAERRALLDVWRAPAKHVWESVFLFGTRFEPLNYCPTPVVELMAREWFDSLHMLPDDGIKLSDGTNLTIRLSWSSYFGSIETSDIRELKKEASTLISTKLWERSDWTKRQDLSPPDFDDEAYVVPDVTERAYAVDPLTGQSVSGYGTIGPASYKSDSGDTHPWRSTGEGSQIFITHWFKSRDGAEKCLALSQGIVDSTRAARLKSSQKKQAADSHKCAASKLQSKMRLLASVVLLSPERQEQVKATIDELDPMLERSKSAPVIKWTAEAVPVINRLIRESLKSDESITATVDGFFAYVMENIADSEQQEQAINAIDQLEALHRKGQLTAAENRTQKINDLLVIILEAMNSASCDGAMETSKAA
jgi:hypothetical protein